MLYLNSVKTSRLGFRLLGYKLILPLELYLFSISGLPCDGSLFFLEIRPRVSSEHKSSVSLADLQGPYLTDFNARKQNVNQW